MLNMIEMSDLWQFKDSLPDGREKELLNNVLFEYSPEPKKRGRPKKIKEED